MSLEKLTMWRRVPRAGMGRAPAPPEAHLPQYRLCFILKYLPVVQTPAPKSRKYPLGTAAAILFGSSQAC